MNKVNWQSVDYFTEDEFKCKCCGLCNVNVNFLCKLEEARRIAGIPFYITSGCRCKEHNKEIGGKENSKHICTEYMQSTAADIKAKTDRRRFIIIQALVEAGFTHIGIGKDFIHVDNDRRLAIWIY